MGENTYIFPKNLAFIGEDCFTTVECKVTDVYVQSTTVPVCEKNAFSTELLWGDGGFDIKAALTDGIYCRDVFNNNGMSIAVLHFPAQEGSGLNDEQYENMAKLYTDITKVYTKKDQTGAVDANGNPLFWPIESEFKRSFHQAEDRALWMDKGYCKEIKDEDGNVVEYSLQLSGNNPNETYTVIEDGTAQEPQSYLNNYIGWHQFVLAYAAFMPTEEPLERHYVLRHDFEGGRTVDGCTQE